MKKLLILICLSHRALIAHEAAENSDFWRSQVFNYIYQSNHWKETESCSGPGSTLEATKSLRTMLPAMTTLLNIHTILDAGCGDFNWMKELNLDLDLYIGVDIVADLIDRNQARYGNEQRCFLCLDITRDHLPKVEAVLCRDCLIHLSYNEIMQTIRNFKQSGITYLFTSNFTRIIANDCDIRTGDYRPINLQKEPFNFPEPIISFEELSAEPEMKRHGKRICVWRIDNIRT